jgi:large subunit ribosomal protein L30
MLKITLTSGLVGKKETQRKVVSALGLGKYGSSVVHADSPTIQGMIRKVHHLVTVEQAEGDGAKAKSSARQAEKKSKKAPASQAQEKQKAESK